MFTQKVFKLYNYQCEIGKSQQKNCLFSKILNKELQYHARMMLDDMFYMISTDRVVDPFTLKNILRYQKMDPDLCYLKNNIDKILDVAEQVVSSNI